MRRLQMITTYLQTLHSIVIHVFRIVAIVFAHVPCDCLTQPLAHWGWYPAMRTEQPQRFLDRDWSDVNGWEYQLGMQQDNIKRVMRQLNLSFDVHGNSRQGALFRKCAVREFRLPRS